MAQTHTGHAREDDRMRQAAVLYTGAKYGNDAFAAGPNGPDMRDHIDMDLTARLTKRINEALSTDMMLAVVYGEGNPNHPGSHHGLSISMSPETGYAGPGYPYLGIFIECAKEAQVLLAILEDQRLEPLRIGVLETINHEIGHMKAAALMDRSVMAGESQRGLLSETLAELYALSRIENGDRSKGIEAVAAAEAIMYYLDSGAGLEKIVSGDLKKFRDEGRLEQVGLTKFSYFADASAQPEILDLARRYAKMLEAVLGRPPTLNAAGALRRQEWQ